MKAIGGFLDGGFGEAGYLEEAARNGGVAGGVEGRRGFGLVGSGGGVGDKRGGGADFDFDVVEGAGRLVEGVARGRGGRFAGRGDDGGVGGQRRGRERTGGKRHVREERDGRE